MLKVKFKLKRALYTKIEDKIPYYQSVLDEHNKSHVKNDLVDINNQLKGLLAIVIVLSM